jgi:hypothetical protein
MHPGCSKKKSSGGQALDGAKLLLLDGGLAAGARSSLFPFPRIIGDKRVSSGGERDGIHGRKWLVGHLAVAARPRWRSLPVREKEAPFAHDGR